MKGVKGYRENKGIKKEEQKNKKKWQKQFFIVASQFLTKSDIGISKYFKNSGNNGTDPSPAPKIPISFDSTKVIFEFGYDFFAVNAVSQPADPPPTTTIFFFILPYLKPINI